jgi:class 3 adenylate cyclase
MGYEKLIASEELEDSVKDQLTSMRDSLIKTFRECRNAHDAVADFREKLELQLGGAFCILGPLGTVQSSWGLGSSGNPGETETAAIFANTFFTDTVITPVDDIQIVFWIFLWVFFLSFFIRNINAVATTLLGIIASVLSVVFFSSLFVYWDLWIHPVIPAASLLFAAFVSLIMGLIFKRRLSLELRRAYSPYVSASALKKIVKRTGPEPWETITAYAAIVAVRSRSVHTSESKDSPVISALAVRTFRDEVSQLWKDAGAVIIGGDGDLVLAAFASPLERSALWNAGIAHQYMNNVDDAGKVNPADKAISAVMEILKRKIDNDGWSFGIDIGECAFTYSDASGYSAFGHAVVKARLLSSLCHKYQEKVLISENVKTQTGTAIETRQLDTLVERELGTKELFFALVK